MAGPELRPWDLGTYVASALTTLRVGHASIAYRAPAEAGAAGTAFLEAIARTRATDVIGLKLDGIPPEALREARSRGVRILLWQVDCFTDRVPRWIGPLAREVDVVAVTAQGMVPAYRRIGPAPVHWIMEGAHLPSFPVVRLSAAQRRLYGSEVAFVGGLRQPPVRNPVAAERRMRLFRRLGSQFQLRIWGPQRAGAVRAATSAPFGLVRWPAYNEELVRVCQASSVVLGVNTINTVHQYFSNRTFLTLASGGFHVTHYVPGLEELFDNHRHLVWFHDDEECVDLCRHYLTRAAARGRVAAAGRQHVRARWSLTRQVGRLLRLLDRS